MKRAIAAIVVAGWTAACGGSGNPPAGGGAPATGSAPAATTPSSTPSGAADKPPAVAPPAAEAKPQFRDVTIPLGTSLHIKLATTVASDTSHAEQTVRGALSEPIVVDDITVAPAGSEVLGSVLEAKQSGRVKGRAEIAIAFDRLRIGSETHTIRTAHIAEEAASTKKKDAEKVGIGAGAGAVIGAIAGGKKGAAVGGAIGAGAGGGVVAATRGDEVRLAAGSVVTTRLQESLTIRVMR